MQVRGRAQWNTHTVGSEDIHMSEFRYRTDTKPNPLDEIHYGNEHNSWTDLRFERVYFHTIHSTRRRPDYCARNYIPSSVLKKDSNIVAVGNGDG